MTEREYILVSAMRQIENAARCLADVAAYGTEPLGDPEIRDKIAIAYGIVRNVEGRLRDKIKLRESK